MYDYSVLIIDDSEINRYILTRTVNDMEFNVDVLEAEDGQQAVELLEDFEKRIEEYKDTFPPIIIFLDINMPLLDGFEFLEEFTELRKEHPSYKKSFVMIYSSSNDPKDQKRAKDFSFVHDFIVKGETSSETIQMKIRQILNEVNTKSKE